jgi:hypothetical protein
MREFRTTYMILTKVLLIKILVRICCAKPLRFLGFQKVMIIINNIIKIYNIIYESKKNEEKVIFCILFFVLFKSFNINL